MPITRRQFELGITSEVEAWMEALYDYLESHKDQAFSVEELGRDLSVGPGDSETEMLDYALGVLVAVGAVESRILDGKTYYAFGQAIEKGIWRLLAPF